MWIKDPSTGLESVSLTLLVVTFICVLITGALNIAGVITSTSLFSEIYYSSIALYFGRKLTVANKGFSSEQAETITKKVE